VASRPDDVTVETPGSNSSSLADEGAASSPAHPLLCGLWACAAGQRAVFLKLTAGQEWEGRKITWC